MNISHRKGKRISQGSSCSIQNNRYKKGFEGDKSGVSGSFGGGLLENSKLVTDEFGSPSESRTFRDLSKYMNKSDKKSSNVNQDLEYEETGQANIVNVKSSVDSMMKSSPPAKNNHILRAQAQERYSSARLQEPEEHYNQTFSTFGPGDDVIPEMSGTKEDRIRPARVSSYNAPRDVYSRLYQPQRKDKVRMLTINSLVEKGNSKFYE